MAKAMVWNATSNRPMPGLHWPPRMAATGVENQQIYLDAMDNDERLDSLNEIRRIEKMIHGGN